MKPKIVIVEDERDIMEDLCALFNGTGFESKGFAEADKALNFIEANPCDLVILGIIMEVPEGWNKENLDWGKKTGMELARRIKKIKPELPMVAYTVYGWNESAIMKEMRDAGITAIIHKPTAFEPILKEVRRLLKK